MITGIHHVSMKCAAREEFDRARAFYTRTLGMKIKREWPAGVMIDTGNGLIEIFCNGEGIREKGAVRHFALATDDVDECVRRVRQAGFRILVEPNDLTIDSTPPFHARMAFCLGPLGEQIEFFMEKEA
ncbi:MAG: VOC family protein [Clostridia bacterium]|nr:VOC family protein [Clostridia bacterium]